MQWYLCLKKKKQISSNGLTKKKRNPIGRELKAKRRVQRRGDSTVAIGYFKGIVMYEKYVEFLKRYVTNILVWVS